MDGCSLGGAIFTRIEPRVVHLLVILGTIIVGRALPFSSRSRQIRRNFQFKPLSPTHPTERCLFLDYVEERSGGTCDHKEAY